MVTAVALCTRYEDQHPYRQWLDLIIATNQQLDIPAHILKKSAWLHHLIVNEARDSTEVSRTWSLRCYTHIELKLVFDQ